MEGPFEAVRISEHVYWVGAIDWGIRDFHGYSTRRGSTYNAYLVEADDLILIDTVKAPFADELLSRISSVASPSDIRYLVSNHAEMDHTGSLPAVLERIEPEKVFASPIGVKALEDHFHLDREIIPIEEGKKLELGGLSFTMLETKMLHWPDSMVTYLEEDRLLFSQDGFGMHLATSERFADEIPESVLLEEGAKYFANILLPYSQLVTKLLGRVEELDIPIDVLAPDHGPVWRKDTGRMMELWGEWAAQRPLRKAVVTFDTMWHSTEKIANAVAEGLIGRGVETVLMPLASCHRSDVITELLDAGALLVGTPTINNNMFPTVADLLTYAKGLKPRNKIGAAFGSYGWSGEGAKIAAGVLEDMKVELVAEPLRIKYVPDFEGLRKCSELGQKVADKLEEVT